MGIMLNFVTILQIYLPRAWQEKESKIHKRRWGQIIQMNHIESRMLFIFVVCPSLWYKCIFCIIFRRLSIPKRTLNNSSYEWNVKITGALLMDFAYLSVKVEPLPMRFRLNKNQDWYKAASSQLIKLMLTLGLLSVINDT